MLKTRLLIIGLILLAILLIFVAFFGGKQKQNQPNIQPTPTPVAPLFPINQASPTAAFIPTGTNTSIDNVTTNNFYQTSEVIDSQGDRTLADSGSYRIVYLPGFHRFLITITGHGFNANRLTAEQALLQQLGISQEDACKLQITVTTTSSANPDNAGQDYPLSFCTTITPSPTTTYRTAEHVTINVGNPTSSGSIGGGASAGDVNTLVTAVNQILTCEDGGAHAPYPFCVRNLPIPQQFKNNLNATYPNFQCGQFIWSAQGLLNWPSFPGNVGSVFQWYTMNPGHTQNGYTFICNPYRVAGCTTSKTSQAGGAIAPGDIIIFGSTGGNDPGHISIVVSTQNDFFTIRVAEANYRHGVTWFRWTNLLDNLGRGANILGWWRKK